MMREEWNQRARKNPYYYISSGPHNWNDADFFRRGEIHTVLFIDRFLEHYHLNPTQMTMLEIGYGVGRMTRTLAKRFKHVYAYDVSDVYVDLAKQKNTNLANVDFYFNDGKTFPQVPDANIDFVFSGWTFQHMPTKDVVVANIKDFARTLKMGGHYKFDPQIHQPQTMKKRTFRIAAKCGLGDHLESTRTFHGVDFTVQEMTNLLSKTTLSVNVMQELDGKQMKYWFNGQKIRN